MGWIRWTYKICRVIHTKHRKKTFSAFIPPSKSQLEVHDWPKNAKLDMVKFVGS